jgi:SNF2 family DNA or RNA helicase
MKTFGSLKLSKDTKSWLLECEPHVVLRLKRVFPKVSRKAHGSIRITNTIDTCRELDWFMSRYPLDVSESDCAALTGSSAAHRDQESLVSELIGGIRRPMEYKLALPPREYQRIAADVTFAQGGLLLADDLGLGKTCSGICLLSRAECRPALVVTMTHLTRQWEREIQKFCPGLTTHILKKGTPYDLRLTKRTKPGQLLLTPETPDVLICNYHKLSGWADTLAPMLTTVIYDEAQELRHNDSGKYRAASHISSHTKWRMGCTATPIYNYGDELFAIMECLVPGRLGSRSEFIEEWCKQANARSYALVDPKAFGSFARDAGIMLQRTRADVGRELPSLTKIPFPIECNTEALDGIESAAGELARIILGEGESHRGAKMQASEELSGLVRQATGIAKAPYVAAFVRMLVESGEQVVLYAWHRAVYDLLMDSLHDLNPVLYTGSESANQKDESKRKFTTGESKILIMSLRAGAGLDGLQFCCKTVVFGELDWSPGVHEQDIGRIHRDGQGNPVFAYFLLADEGSDPIVADVLGLKKAQADGVMGERDAVLDSAGANAKALAQLYIKNKDAELQAAQ